MLLKADSEGPDHTAQLHSLIRAFTVCACPEGILLLGIAQMINMVCEDKGTRAA